MPMRLDPKHKSPQVEGQPTSQPQEGDLGRSRDCQARGSPV
jgi:hypothetical protein